MAQSPEQTAGLIPSPHLRGRNENTISTKILSVISFPTSPPIAYQGYRIYKEHPPSLTADDYSHYASQETVAGTPKLSTKLLDKLGFKLERGDWPIH